MTLIRDYGKLEMMRSVERVPNADDHQLTGDS